MSTRKVITQVAAMKELQNCQHDISQELATCMVKNYKQFRKKLMRAKNTSGMLPADTPVLPVCLTYNRDAILNLMKAPGCSAIRMYLAINKSKQLTLVIVGVDESGNNILPVKENKQPKTSSLIAKASTTNTATLLDEGQASPPYPGEEF